MPDFFQSWPPTAAELEKYYAAMTVDDDMVLRELRRQMVSDLARMLRPKGRRGRLFALVERYASNFTSYAANTNGIRTIPVLRLTPEAR